MDNSQKKKALKRTVGTYNINHQNDFQSLCDELVLGASGTNSLNPKSDAVDKENFENSIFKTFQKVNSQTGLAFSQVSCYACKCNNFETNNWKPGFCSVCLHHHKKPVPFSRCGSGSLPPPKEISLDTSGVQTQEEADSVFEEISEYLAQHPKVASAILRPLAPSSQESSDSYIIGFIRLKTNTDENSSQLTKLPSFFEDKEVQSQIQAMIWKRYSSASSDIQVGIPLVEIEEGLSIQKQEKPQDAETDETSTIEFVEHDAFYYRDNFLKFPRDYVELTKAQKMYQLGSIGQLTEKDFYNHLNILAIQDSAKLIISLRKEVNEYSNYLGILRSKLGDCPFFIPSSSVKSPSSKNLIAALTKKFAVLNGMNFFVIKSPADKKNSAPIANGKILPQSLLDFDNMLKVQNYKIGIIYVAPGQSSWSDVMKNPQTPSKLFEDFLNLLGNRITLKDWRGYRGDLDVKENSSGEFSYFTQWNSLSIMFHIFNLLPVSSRQSILGNDIVTIVFKDYNPQIPCVPWKPSSLVSTVLHVQIVIEPIVQGKTVKFRVVTVVRDGVPHFGPFSSQLFELNSEFKEWILFKIINGERASWHCGTRVRSQQKSLLEHYQAVRDGQINYIISNYKSFAQQM